MAPWRLWCTESLPIPTGICNSLLTTPRVKRGLLKCLFNRSRKVTDGQARTEVEDFLCDVLRGNGYDDKFVRESMTISVPNNCQDPPKITTLIPYIEGLSNVNSQICRKFSISTFFRPVTTIRKRLVHPKDPIPAEKRTGVVYEVPSAVAKCT